MFQLKRIASQVRRQKMDPQPDQDSSRNRSKALRAVVLCPHVRLLFFSCSICMSNQEARNRHARKIFLETFCYSGKFYFLCDRRLSRKFPASRLDVYTSSVL